MLLERDDTRPPVFERTHYFANAPVRLVDGTMVAASELADRIYNSEIGQAMLDQPLRYAAKYGYDRDAMIHDNGYDLCPIGHQWELPYHTAKVLEVEMQEGTLYGSLSDEELGLLMFALQIHDMGESIHDSIEAAGFTIVGDIPAGFKTEEDRINEATIRKFMYETFFADVDPAVIKRVEAIISHQDASILHELFEAGHLAQTLETSDFAYHSLARERWYMEGDVITVSSDDGSRMSGLLGIAREAYCFIQTDVKKYSHFSYIRAAAERADNLRFPKYSLYS